MKYEYLVLLSCMISVQKCVRKKQRQEEINWASGTHKCLVIVSATAVYDLPQFACFSQVVVCDATPEVFESVYLIVMPGIK